MRKVLLNIQYFFFIINALLDIIYFWYLNSFLYLVYVLERVGTKIFFLRFSILKKLKFKEKNVLSELPQSKSLFHAKSEFLNCEFCTFLPSQPPLNIKRK